MTDDERWQVAVVKSLEAIQETMLNMAADLASGNADLAEIKARLAHASPGYDMRGPAEEDPDALFAQFEARMAGEQEEGR